MDRRAGRLGDPAYADFNRPPCFCRWAAAPFHSDLEAYVSNGIHSAGVRAAAAAIPSCASRTRLVCRMAATMAPTIGAERYSQASLKLPVATIGPSARAGLKAAPVRAPPMMMLRVNVIPIAS